MTSIRWTDVAHDFVDETTAVGVGNRSKECLFNLITLATIDPVIVGDTSNKPIEVPSIHTSCNWKYVAVGSDNDLNLFILEPILCRSLSFSEKISNLTWLPSSSLLLCVTSDLVMHVIDAEMNQTLCRKKLNKSNNLLASASDIQSTCSTSVNGLTIVLFSCNGAMKKCIFHDLKSLNYALEEQNLKAIKESLSKIEIVEIPCAERVEVAFTQPSMNNEQDISFCLSPADQCVLIYSDEGFEEYISFEHFDYGPPIKAQITRNGQYFLVLCKNGQLLLEDALSGVLLSQIDESIADFVILDGKSERNGLDFRIMVIKDKMNSKGLVENSLEILDLANMQVEFTCRIEKGCHLVHTETYSNQVSPMLVQFKDGKHLRLEAVHEATPHTKLMKFMAKGNFKDAENFAKLFNLDLQTVYTRELDYSIGNLSGSGLSPDQFGRICLCIRSTSDPSTVLKSCVQVSKLLPRQEWIKKVVELGEEKLSKTSIDYSSLTRIACMLCTYSMVMGSDASTTMDTYWPVILKDINDSSTWYMIMLELMQACQFDAVSCVWAREANNIRTLLRKTKAYDVILNTAFQAISYLDKNEVEKQTELSHIMEYQILPDLLLDASDSIGPSVCEWFIQLCHWLEANSTNQWPANAFHWAGMIRRICHGYWKDSYFNCSHATTPAQSAQAAYCCNQLQLDCPNKGTPVYRLLELETQLTILCRLHSVYKCKISYEVYCKQTVQSICYRILDREKAVDCLSQSIINFARPYMNENQLDEDKTLHDYVIDVLKSFTEGLSKEARALAVIHCINSEEWRFESIVELAKKATVPWSKHIQRLVDNVLSTKHSICSELREVCRLSELKSIVNQYLISAAQLASCLATPDSMLTLIKFILKEAPARNLAGLNDALKVAELSKMLSAEDVYVYHMVKLINDAKLLDVLKLLESLDPALKLIVAERVLLRLSVLHGKQSNLSPDLCETIVILYEKFLKNGLKAEKQLHYSSFVQTARYLSKIQGLIPSELLDVCNPDNMRSSSNMLDTLIREALEKSDDADFVFRVILIKARAFSFLDSWTLLTKTLKICMLKSNLRMSCQIFRLFVVNCNLKFGQALIVCGRLLTTVASLTIQDKLLAIDTSYDVLLHFLNNEDFENYAKLVQLVRLCRISKTICTVLLNPVLDVEHIFGMDAVHGTYTYFHEENVGCEIENTSQLICRGLANLMTNKDCSNEWNSVAKGLQSGGHRLLSIFVQLQVQPESVDLSIIANEFVQSMVIRASSVPVDYALCSAMCLIPPNPKDVLKSMQVSCSRLSHNSFRPWNLLAGTGVLISTLVHTVTLPSTNLIKTCADLLIQVRWCSKLAKYNIHMGVTQNNLSDRMRIIKEMAACGVPVSLVTDFVFRFSLDVVDCTLLFIKSCLIPFKPDRDIKKSEHIVKSSLRLLNKITRKSFPKERVRECLENVVFEVDPYDYEAIELLLNLLQDMNGVADPRIPVLQFVQSYVRISAPGDTEKVWYRERCDTVHHVQDPDSTSLDFLENCDGPAPVKLLPALSTKRLPFHAFLPQKHLSSDQPTPILKEIVMNNELNLHTVQSWLQLAENQYVISLPSSQLIMQLVKNVIADKGLDRLVFDKLCSIMKRCDDQAATLKCVAYLAKHLPISELKIRAAQFGAEISKSWLENARTKHNEKEIQEATKFEIAFSKAVLALGTEFLVRQAGLYNENTKRLISNPHQLIIFLLEHTKLNEKTISYIQRIAAAAEIDLHQVLDGLIDKWIKMDNAQSLTSLDETVVGVSSVKNTSVTSTKVEYFSEDMNRLVLILKQNEIQRTCKKLVSVVNRGSPFDQVVPLLCLFRILPPSQMSASLLLKSSIDLRNDLEDCLYMQMLSVARLPYTMESMKTKDKTQMIENLLRNISVPGIPLLAASLIIDNSISISMSTLSVLCKHLKQNPHFLLQFIMYANKMDEITQDYWKQLIQQKLPSSTASHDESLLQIWYTALRCPRYTYSNAQTLQTAFSQYSSFKKRADLFLSSV